MRDDYYGLWIAEDGKAVYIERDGEAVRVSVSPSVVAPYDPDTGSPHFSSPEAMPAVWVDEARLPYLMAEADRQNPGTGRTYHLSFAVQNTEADRYDGFRWRPVNVGDPIEHVRIVPDTGAGFIDAVSYQEDEGEVPWATPLRPLRKASERELQIYLERHPGRTAPRKHP